MNSNTYKIYQLVHYFITKCNYISFYISGLKQANEMWLVNKENKSYQIIRVSTNASLENDSYVKRVNAYIDTIKHRFLIHNVNFLDIRITSDTYIPSENFETVFMESGVISNANLKNIYPGIDNVIHDVDDVDKEVKELIDSMNRNMALNRKNNFKKTKLSKLLTSTYLITTIIIVVCSLLFFATIYLSRNRSMSSALVFLGGDYKFFTLGLGQYWRLFTSAFLHGSFIHLLCNMMSLFSVGIILEPMLGKGKYILLIVCSILVSSLSSGILNPNSLTIGFSGAIYAMIAYFLMYIIFERKARASAYTPSIITCLVVNLLPNVSWSAHLGGAVCGILFYYIYENDNLNINLLPLIVILIGVMFYKYYSDFNIKPYNKALDLELIDLYKDESMDDYADKLQIKMMEMYSIKED